MPPPLPSPLSYVFVEPKDTTGQAVLLRRVRPTLTTSTVVRTADASSVSSTPPLAVREEVQTFVIAAVTDEHNTLRSNDQVSRTQKWHLLKSSQGEVSPHLRGHEGCITVVNVEKCEVS